MTCRPLGGRAFLNPAGLLILAVFLLVCPGPIGYLGAQNHWDALLELGFDPADGTVHPAAACDRIEKIHRWKARVAGTVEADTALGAQIRDLDARMATLDAGNLYELAPYAGPNRWRGIGISARSDSETYHVTLENPGIENWLAEGTNAPGWPPEGRKRFGDIGLRAFVRPQGRDTYRYQSEGTFYLQEIPLANVIRAMSHLLANIRRAAPPTPLMTPTLPLNDNAGLQILAGFARDFPHLFALINRYFEIELTVTTLPAGSRRWAVFDLTARGDRSTLREDYPSIWHILKLMQDTISSHTRVLNEQAQLVAAAVFYSAKDTYHWRIFFSDDEPRRPLPMKGPRKPDHCFLTGSDPVNLTVLQDATIDLLGLSVSIEGLEAALDYTFYGSGPHLSLLLNRRPAGIAAGGRVLQVIPIWLVDLLIPSSVEKTIDAFFHTLATGNRGQGASLHLGRFSDGVQDETAWIHAAADILANGTIRLGFNLQRQLFARQEALPDEAASMRSALWKAFDLDFKMAKARGVCR